MKFLFHRAAPTATAVGLMLLPIGAQAASAPKSLEARLQEALGGASIVHIAAMSNPADEGSAAQLLSSRLPSGVTLKSASDEQMTEAVEAAVAQDPNMAASIVRIAIITKVPASERKGAPVRSHRQMRAESDGKSVSQTSTYNPWATAGVSAAQPHVFIAVITRNVNSFVYDLIFRVVTKLKDKPEGMGRITEVVREAIGIAPRYAETITQAALDALRGDEYKDLRREIIGVAQLSPNISQEQRSAIASLGGTSGGGDVGGILTSGGLGASSIAGAPAGAGIINPANIGAGTTTTTTSASTQP